MDLTNTSSIFNYLGNIKGVVAAVIILIILLSIFILTRLLDMNIHTLLKKIGNILISLFGAKIGKKEAKYHRDLAIGKLDEKRRKVRTYRFLNDLIIDLGLKQKGATPYEFLFLVLIGCALITIVGTLLIFGNIWIGFAMYPIVFAGTMCILYTKSNIAHDTRIEAVIEAENIICNNIKGGVVLAVRSSINTMPVQVRGEFRDFLDNVEHKNYHIKTALQELNMHLGSIADDFIKKCIVFELEEEHGIVDMFKDVVELNNIKMEMRTEMKRKFEEVTTQFIIGAVMIFIFLGGVLALYENIANFYFKTAIGQIILAIDGLILIGEFVYITYLRASEL